MIRLALIAVHAVLRKAARIVARAANVPSDGHVEIHLGSWCERMRENRSRGQLLMTTSYGVDGMPIDRIDRGLVLSIATHSWQDGGAEIYVLLAGREVTEDGASAMAKAYEEEYDRPIEEDSQ